MHTSIARRTQGRRRRAVLALPVFLATAIGLAACGSSSATGGAAPQYGGAPSPSKAAAPASSGIELTLCSTSLGTILTDGRGITLYAFEADKGTTSSCSGACATAWPPLTATATAKVGAGIKQSLVGKTTRADGTQELTYAGHPLYYFAGDSAPGDTSGQGSRGFGARWDVLTAAGQEVTTGG